MYALLNQERIPFDLVHENDLTPARLKPYDLLILPNFAFMSDAQAAALRAYATSGGSLLATFETGLYDEAGKPRDDFALAGLFGIAKDGPARMIPSAISPAALFTPTTVQLLRRPGEPSPAVAVVGASRTDAGVHARGQAAHLVLAEPFPARGLVHGTNHHLPEDVRVLAAERMPEGFHARKDALGKEYHYRLSRAPVLSPLYCRRSVVYCHLVRRYQPGGSSTKNRALLPRWSISSVDSGCARIRFVNQLESGTSSIVLTFIARTPVALSPGWPNRFVVRSTNRSIVHSLTPDASWVSGSRVKGSSR